MLVNWEYSVNWKEYAILETGANDYPWNKASDIYKEFLDVLFSWKSLGDGQCLSVGIFITSFKLEVVFVLKLNMMCVNEPNVGRVGVNRRLRSNYQLNLFCSRSTKGSFTKSFDTNFEGYTVFSNFLGFPGYPYWGIDSVYILKVNSLL